MSLWSETLTLFESNNIFRYGVGPVGAFVLGFTLVACPLELLIRQPWMNQYMLTYPKNGTRVDCIKRTEEVVSFWEQTAGAINTLFGPTAILNGITGYLLMSTLIPKHRTFFPPSYGAMILDIVLMELIGDFFLYWGHRIQHDIPYLWDNFHSIHHKLETPTPVSTLYIHSVDATLQGALPIMFAIILSRPHTLCMYCYIFLRVGENAVNHSGLRPHWLLDLVTLKCLPGRATVGHHDAHHKYSHYGANAKNYAENFWIWDYMFGTLRR